MLFTFLTTLIVYSVKKVHKTYCCSSGIACLEKRTDLILRKLVFNDKSLLYFPMASTLQFFSEDQSDQGVTQLIIKPLGISQTSKIVSVSQKKCQVFQNALLLFIDFFRQYLTYILRPIPLPRYQCCFQMSETVSWHKLWCCYSSNNLQHWVGGRDLIYFCNVDYTRTSRNFSRNWLSLNNLSEILYLR